MRSQSSDHVPFSSGRYEADINDILSTASDESTPVDNTEVIQILLANQPFVLYHDPSSTQDMVVIRSAQFRNFLTKEEQHSQLTANVPWLATVLEKHRELWPGAYVPLQLLSLHRVMTMGDMDRESDENWRRHYGESLIAGSLTKDRKVQLDDRKRLANHGTFYKSRLDHAYMPPAGEPGVYRLDFTVSGAVGTFKKVVYLSDEEIHRPEKQGIYLYASLVKNQAEFGRHASRPCNHCGCNLGCEKENVRPWTERSPPGMALIPSESSSPALGDVSERTNLHGRKRAGTGRDNVKEKRQRM